MDTAEEMVQGFSQLQEFRFFHESCKVEDTASSHDRVVKGKHSQYINMRLSYGMAKDPTDYLAAVQRWAEGGVVLSLQTFFGSDQGVFQIWCAFLIWLAFVISLFFLVYGVGTRPIMYGLFGLFAGDDMIMNCAKMGVADVVELLVLKAGLAPEWATDYEEMLFDVMLWIVGLIISVCMLWVITRISYCVHQCTCCGRRKPWRRTRFPTSMSQWGRLLIVVNNLTYFLWFWTAFMWIGYNFYGVFAETQHSFDPYQMMPLSWLLQVLSWSMVIFSALRYQIRESLGSNEVFSLTLTNIWRTTQMFYITAPLTLYSILMGTLDFLRNRSFGEDISYWVGGDRGAVSEQIVMYWTLSLILLTLATWICRFLGILPNGASAGAAVLIVTFIGLDVLLPCAYLWLGNKMESVPPPFDCKDDFSEGGIFSQLQSILRRCCQKLTCLAWHRNNLRAIIFSKATTSVLKWVGPAQQLGLPFLIIFFPSLGINVAIMATIAGRN